MTKIDELRPYVHHHSSDPAFCGSTLPMRAFDTRFWKVTCPRCRPMLAAAEVVAIEDQNKVDT